MKQTSIDTYHNIVNNGLLSKRRLEVYKALYELGPMTQNEMVRHFKQFYPNSNPSGFHARFSELEKMKVIIPIGVKKDSVSNQECIIWATTDNLPVKLEKLPTFKEKKKEILEDIVTLGKKLPNFPKCYRRELKDIYLKIKQL